MPFKKLASHEHFDITCRMAAWKRIEYLDCSTGLSLCPRSSIHQNIAMFHKDLFDGGAGHALIGARQKYAERSGTRLWSHLEE